MVISRESVESIKMAIQQLPYNGISMEKTLVGSIQHLVEFYDLFHDPQYLKTALPFISVYLELGYSYEANEKIFDKILKQLNLERVVLFPKLMWKKYKIPLTRAQVKKAIGKWSSSRYHTMPIREVVDDIIDKTLKKQEGQYEYHSNKRPDGKGIDKCFVLMIGSDETILKDVQKNIYYTLDQSRVD